MRLSIVVGLLIVLLIAIGSKDIAIPLLYRYDPPSIYNPGAGGYSELYSILRRDYIDVSTILDLRDLIEYDPDRWILILASPDQSIDPIHVEALNRWVNAGGVAIILDEVGTVDPVLRYFGLELLDLIRDINVARCVIDGREVPIVFNIYSGIEVVEDKGYEISVLCRYGFSVLAISVRVGDGVLYVFGDSSLFINGNPRDVFDAHISLLKEISGDRGILFYEGDRSYLYLHTRWFFTGLLLFMAIIKLIVDQILMGDLAVKAIIVSVISLIFISYYINPLGVDRIARFRRVRTYNIRDQVKSIRRGVERWRRYLMKS